jgi:signal transduction histidine kinase
MYLMVAVKDTGIGISKDGQAKLFERFRYKQSSSSPHPISLR